MVYYTHFWANILGKGIDTLIYPTSYGLNSAATNFLQGLIWHLITHVVWYAIKQRNPASKEGRSSTKQPGSGDSGNT